MMKHWLAGAVAAPFLIACASAGAQSAAEDNASSRVLVVNGERIVIGENGDAASAIEEALAAGPGSRRLVLEFGNDGSNAWPAEEREAFARAMAELAEAFSHDFQGDFDFDVDVDFDDDHASWTGSDDERVEVMVRQIERRAERHAERVERQAERLSRRAEAMARRMERHGARAELHGLRAGVEGVQDGVEGVDETLERGWYYEWNDGERERVALTEDKRADLIETREELLETLEALRANLARAENRHGVEHREVRIVRRNGEARAWVNGEEATGSQLDALLDGAPDTPEPPEAPREQD